MPATAPSSSPAPPAERTLTAVGVVRVSVQGDRADEDFHSPDAQREAIERLCERKGWRLSEVLPAEINVSGGALLEARPSLSRAVMAVQTGRADVIVALDSSRLWRSTEVRQQVLRLVGAAGGHVWTAKDGEVSERSARRKFGGVVVTAADEMYREEIAEKSAEGQRIAAEAGIPPMMLPPGLSREVIGQDRHGKLIRGAVVIDEPVAAIVREAFRLRATGSTIAAVREHLRAHGIDRSHNGTRTLLSSQLLMGRFTFGDLSGTVPAVIDEALWHRVQRVSVPRGRRAKSERLLARLGVLRCGTCGARMVVGSANHGQYAIYRCPPTGDCTRRVTIAAELVEGVVIETVRDLLAGIEGRAGADTAAREAADALEAAQAALDGAIAAFSGLGPEPAAVARLGELRDARDAARAEHERAQDARGATSVAVTVGDWDDLTQDERRGLVGAVIERVVIAPGRGASRITVEPRT